jgi:enamine deaminase RidA (YjgF/YER057c/UK114 family)
VNREIKPSSIAPPAANYAHAVLTEHAGSILHVSGVVAARPDGSIPDDVEDQAAVIWSNIGAILAEAGMGLTDIVSITTYVVVDFMACLPEVMAARDQALSGHRAASTLVTVPALARAAWKMEVAVIAAR